MENADVRQVDNSLKTLRGLQTPVHGGFRTWLRSQGVEGCRGVGVGVEWFLMNLSTLILWGWSLKLTLLGFLWICCLDEVIPPCHFKQVMQTILYYSIFYYVQTWVTYRARRNQVPATKLLNSVGFEDERDFFFQTEAAFFRHMECSAGVDETEVVEIVAICLEFLIKEELKHIK